MSKLTPTEVFQALVVEVIRRLWDRGLYRENPWLKRIVEEWFDLWVEFKTQTTMKEVDKQIEELNPDPVDFAQPVYWEEEYGETPLGGPMGIRHDFTDNNP